MDKYWEWTVGLLTWGLCVNACHIMHIINIIPTSQLHFPPK